MRAKVIIASIAAATIFASLAPLPAQADDVQPIPLIVIDMTTAAPDASGISSFEVKIPAGTYRDAVGQVLKAPTGITYNCFGVQHRPHFSKGANGVISKAQIKCTGPAGSIRIKVNSALAKAPTNTPSQLALKASSSYAQTIKTNTKGWGQTWYVPALGKPGVPQGAKGWWRAAHSGMSMPPLKTFYTSPGMSAMTPLG